MAEQEVKNPDETMEEAVETADETMEAQTETNAEETTDSGETKEADASETKEGKGIFKKKEKKDKDNFLGLYVGAGYGSRERYWLHPDIDSWLKYLPNSYSGISANIGLIGSRHGLTIMAGVNTLAFKYVEAEIGLGYTF